MSFHITTENLFGQLLYIAKNKGRRISDVELNSKTTGTVRVNMKMRDVNSKSICSYLLMENLITTILNESQLLQHFYIGS